MLGNFGVLGYIVIMDTKTHFPDHGEPNTYEEGVHLNKREKLMLALVVGGMGLLMVLILIGIGF
ncbi:hypothetical protein GCM10007047_31420 [Cerasicoccus arenae]|uniref:Uncharacterized protein n=2 Tax=Cerasicoccus arenae TaxID=424488 RepID=A0A8J3DII7_9BACT|nr:hypothetical protein GCM10007047_31420 [Cerasicoccus arenae]